MSNLDSVPKSKEYGKYKTMVHAQVLKKALHKHDSLKERMQSKGKITPEIKR